MGEKWSWNRAQREVIESPSGKRILVNAGPGTGKTAVACARVAWLIDNCGVNAGNIWMISFTRSAVQEIHNRIKLLLKDEGNAYAVNVATLDSHAWKIHSGFDRGAELLGTYEDNIEKLTNMVKKDIGEEISEYLETVQHLVIDEAQDIVGIRSDLVMKIVEKLSDDCGVTIFSDEAQAIYGFSLDEDIRTSGDRQRTLYEKILDSHGSDFCNLTLEEVFRTQSTTLNKLFTITRQKVMKLAENPREKFLKIRQEIIELADSKNIIIDDENSTYPDDCFILYRKRAEVLLRTSFIGEKPHRIRMSGLPLSIYPWIGACLSEHTKERVTKKEFMDYWNEKVANTPFEKDIDQENAWYKLVRLAGKSEKVVDMSLLRRRLGQQKPPAEFCKTEIGTEGPIIGTIHASKGREENKVYLMMPAEPEEDVDDDYITDYEEETRVIFVGATRARKWLGVGAGVKRHFSSRVESSGRVFATKGKGTAMVEIGREGDITASGIASREYYEDDNTVRKNQERMYYLAGKITKASAFMDRENGFIYRVIPENDHEDIVVLSQQALSRDLFEIGKKINDGNRRTPDTLKHLRIYGIKTIVLPPDSPECNRLHEPWAGSGIMLAPIVLGYTKELFPYYKPKK
jgi:hypothetical protein